MYEGLKLDESNKEEKSPKRKPYSNRIMICGPSGTGKTTMAKFIAEEFGLDYISSSAGDIWPKYGFKNHIDSIRKIKDNPTMGFAYQYEVLTRREMVIDEWKKHHCIYEGYVMDRSFVDMYAYACMELGGLVDDRFLDIIYDDCKKGMQGVTNLLFIPFTNDTILEDNGRRVISKHFQSIINGVMDYILFSTDMCDGIKVYRLSEWDLEKREEIVKKWVEGI